MEADNSSAFVISDQGWIIVDNIFKDLSELMSSEGYTDLKERFYHLAKPSHLTKNTLIDFIQKLITNTNGIIRVKRMGTIIDELFEAYQIRGTSRQLIIDEDKRRQLLRRYTPEYRGLELHNPVKDYIIKITDGHPDNKAIIADNLVSKLGEVHEYINLSSEQLDDNQYLLDWMKEETTHTMLITLRFLADVEGIYDQ